ncbi:MAG: formate dehydrogenase subunit alpha [Candidatus Abyssobacteria bacterium SURF_17]|uniref:Formate dehydrogenase subunit alpha n=1 Tax=Candidatus Abyssobacteria bacterium SURF_17 TaxID=2093361 RepID=A0A419EPF8_9BACT|nr:MAG: formate dehydrogenase subunit alpha [Candidatus Abyssubacteria bacterium SURF_17]
MKAVTLTIDGRAISVPNGSTVLDAIRKAGIYVPTLCHDAVLKPYGACRLCIVQIKGMRGLPTSCTTPVAEGMVVTTETEEIQRIRRTIVELAIANHPYGCLVCDKSEECELLNVARYVGAQQSSVDRMRRASLNKAVDTSNPAFDFDPNKCILCGKCVRICNEVVGRGAIDFAYRGQNTLVCTFGGRPLALSACQNCGECVEYCPTGALSAKQTIIPQREVKTVCPYCGVGCSMLLGVRGQKIVRVRAAKENSVNTEGLCVKGRYGLDFVNHPDRLTRPLIRRDDAPKGAARRKPADDFREADWNEALDRVAQGLARVRDESGADAIGVISSAKCTNEDNYIIQKFARAALGTNNVDHCARLCHASTVAAALAAFGDGAMSNSISDIDCANVLFVIGSNTTECHPIIGRRIKRAVKFNGAKLIVADPRSIELAEMADVHLNHFPGTDIALLNGIMREIVTRNLYDKKFVTERCEDFEPFLESLDRYPLEAVEEATGVAREKIQQAAMVFGKAKRAAVLYGMGITQHTTGTDNVKAVANLLMLTGNLGRRGTGFSPLRGQNNVQGSCDMGALPTVFPGYQRVSDPQVRAKFEQAWGRKLSDQPGRTLTEMFQTIHDDKIKALYVVGENPTLSEPDAEHAKGALAKLDFLVVQDIFLTETAQMADVVLPATSFAEKDGTFTNTERRVQLVRKAIEPLGETRVDWQIIADVSARMGYPMNYSSAADIMEEVAQLTPIYGGIHYDRLENGGLQWPCWNRRHKGTPILHKDKFTRGRGKFHVVHDNPPAELPTRAYPLVLNTGRILEHWHTGSMSHRSRVLEAIASESSIEISHVDAAQLGIEEGDTVSVSSRRGTVRTKARKTGRVKPGEAFMAFHWWDAPANLLTNPVLDPQAKIPEFKVASVRTMLAVLERAAEDNAFLSALAENPAGILKSYDLTPEHRSALMNGDIAAIEKWVGPLEERLKVWLKARLKQENLAEV